MVCFQAVETPFPLYTFVVEIQAIVLRPGEVGVVRRFQYDIAEGVGGS